MLKQRRQRRRNASRMNTVAVEVLESRQLKMNIVAALADGAVTAVPQQTGDVIGSKSPETSAAVNGPVLADSPMGVSPAITQIQTERVDAYFAVVARSGLPNDLAKIISELNVDQARKVKDEIEKAQAGQDREDAAPQQDSNENGAPPMSTMPQSEWDFLRQARQDQRDEWDDDDIY